MKILLIDDEPFALKLLSRQFATLGFENVTLCGGGHDALSLLESGADGIDLIFCDLQMPEMDGVEFVRHLVRIGYSGGLVLVSGEDGRILQTVERLAKAHQLHVLGTLQKPVSSVELGQLLECKLPNAAEPFQPVRKTYAPDELLWAIAEGQLINYYQPKVDLASGVVTGVEALVRWQHPDDGLIFPDQFLSTAEEHDLIDDLTKTVLASALYQARLWRDAGLSLQMAINISMENLDALNFPDYIARLVEKAGIPLTSVLLEVTEIGLMKNPLASLDILTRLRLKHIFLSIDDFGSRHASLTQLRSIPFDELKINRTFVHGAGRDASISAIYMASLELARQLGMKTVAEGVEDRHDWDFVRASGCDLAQGYFIAKPMPAADMIGWMADWEDRQRDLFVYSDVLSAHNKWA
ncbi:MAG: EAL domain-containing response regulator [Pseudogulbenkiania sp.]|nr:EAL domain-containing response regulator [Pseudogulbenkiania sp.]